MKTRVARVLSRVSSRVRYVRRFAGPGLDRQVPSTVHVLVTTVEGTHAALAAALPIARKRGAPVVLLVERDDWQTARCLRAARTLDPAMTAKHLVGSDIVEAVTAVVPVLALIVIGGRTRWWWPTRDERVAARLQRRGRTVRFVGCPTTPESSDHRSGSSDRRDLADVQRFAR